PTALSWDHEDKAGRHEAHGWHVQSVADVNDLDALTAALAAAERETDRPSLIQVRSHIAFPAPNAQDTAKAHGAPLGEDEVRAAKERMGLDPDRRFDVPPDVRRHMDLAEQGRRAEQAWQQRFSAWRA